jgi:hypothetical protein
MNQNQNNQSPALGVVNELLMAGGAALITFGVNVTENQTSLAAGLIMALLSLVLMFTRHQGAELIMSGVRKVLSSAGGVAVAFGFLTPEKVDAILAVAGPVVSLIPIIWTARSKGAFKTPGKLPMVFIPLVLALALLGLQSCANSSLTFTPDGCILNDYTADNGQSYRAGFCVDQEGKVDRAAVEWENQDGQEIRLTVNKDRKVRVQYRPDPAAPWIAWSSKSGITIGPVPPAVVPALDNGTADPADIVPTSPAEPVL